MDIINFQKTAFVFIIYILSVITASFIIFMIISLKILKYREKKSSRSGKKRKPIKKPFIKFAVFTCLLLAVTIRPASKVIFNEEITTDIIHKTATFSEKYIDKSNEKESVFVSETEVIYYNQEEEPWGSMNYGTDSFAETGCGPTSLAMVLSTLTGNEYTPKDMCDWAYDNNYWSPGTGSYHSLIPDCLNAYGFKCEFANENTKETIKSALYEGKLIIALMGEGHFTKGGHFIVLNGITEDEKVKVSDSKSRDRTEELWDLDTIVKESKQNAAAGGPFWIVS